MSSVKIKPGSNCKTKGVIYAVNCKKCQEIYVGHTGDTMKIRWSKHKYDIINRPGQNELATHCHNNHDITKDLEIFILDHGLHSFAGRERMEDKYICKLQTHQSNKGGINSEVHSYAKEMYTLWTNVMVKSKSP